MTRKKVITTHQKIIIYNNFGRENGHFFLKNVIQNFSFLLKLGARSPPLIQLEMKSGISALASLAAKVEWRMESKALVKSSDMIVTLSLVARCSVV